MIINYYFRGLNTVAYPLCNFSFDVLDGMMFRGLGGLKLRDQNHQIIEGKFADEEADEQMDVRSDVSKST